MLKVGITGGIGSGKSIVCQVFATLGIPVFNADAAARYLMEHDSKLKADIISTLGEETYKNGMPDRGKIASVVFSNPDKLQELNSLVHPATIAYGKEWMEKQQAPYVLREAAILFESGSYKDLDVVIGIYAPAELRMQRAMMRSKLTKEEVQKRMAQQMNEDEKMKRCNYVITNDDKTAIIPQVLLIHELLLKQSTSAS